MGSRRPRHADRARPLGIRPVRLVRAGAASRTVVDGSQSYRGSQSRMTTRATRKTLRTRIRKKSDGAAERKAAGQKEELEAEVRAHGVQAAAVALANRRRHETSSRRRVLQCLLRRRATEAAETEKKARPQRRGPRVRRAAAVEAEVVAHQSARRPKKPQVVEVHPRQSAARSETAVKVPAALPQLAQAEKLKSTMMRMMLAWPTT